MNRTRVFLHALVVLSLALTALGAAFQPQIVPVASAAATCEDFNSGYTVGQVVGNHADWVDGGSGPIVTSGNGVAGSVGLAPASDIFTWVAHPFNWNAAGFQGVSIGMDFKTDASGHFDDDRVGWMITDSNVESTNIFGVQMDPDAGSGYNIEGYWKNNASTPGDARPSIVTLPTLTGNAWYNLQAEITRLTATSARIDVTLTALNADGSLGSVVASGSVADTSALGADAPNAKYFTPTTMWPAYKNYTGAGAPADNACFETIAAQHTLTANVTGNGDVTLDPPGGTYDEGTEVQLTAVPDSGWVFSGWSGDLSGSTNPTSITVDENKSVTATFTEQELSSEACEDFNSGYTVGQVVGNHADWVDGGSGPVVTSGNGVAGSVGLAPASDIFTWVAHPFNWNAAGFQGVRIGMDFKTDASGHFDDDRVGWMITDSNVESTNIFGVQMDPDAGSGYNIEGYWKNNASTPGDARPSIVTLPTLTGNAWYNLQAEITQLTATSARIDVTLTALNADGSLGSVVASGSVADTSALGADAPNTKYFTPTTMWPAYKNYTGAGAPADNACFETIAAQHTLTANVTGNGDVTLDPSGGTYDEGTEVQLTAVPDSGWVFSGWSGDLSGSTNPTSITMDENKSVTATFTEQQVTSEVCEDFDSGYTVGQVVGNHADWYDGGSGPIVTSANGVVGSVGLAPATNIFTWVAHPFNWNAADFVGINLSMDYQTDASGHFDDDRIGWMITDSSVDSTNIFGVQMDPDAGSGYNIEGYWKNNASTPGDARPSIVTLPTLTANAWYNLQTEITRLTATSARIDVTLTALNTDGSLGSVVASGSVADTSALGADAPNTKYFTPTTMWPAYKNYTAVQGAVDNACVEILAGSPTQHTLTVNVVGSGSVGKSPDQAQYNYGTTVQLTATPETGWVFTGWSGDLTGSTNPASITMNATKTVTATFAQEQFTLGVNVVGNGTVTKSPNKTLYAQGEVVQLTAVPDSGWALSGWSGDLSGSTNPTSITMDENKSVTATFTDQQVSSEACEDFNSGYTVGQVVGTHADWYDGGSGPVVTSANGVAGSVGLAPATNIFTWVAHPFNWNDADFVGVNLSMDYQTDASGHFDDDRMGWMIDDTDTDSSLFFGVQMDPDAGTGYNIEGYWDGTSSTDERRPSLVTLPTLTANAWYNLQTEITKLTATSARIEVTLTALNSDGSLGAAVATGSIADTSALGADAPNLQYFTATSMWPAYKNFTAVVGAVDNPCVDIVRQSPDPKFAFVVVSDLHTSSNEAAVQSNLGQIRDWLDNPTADMPAPEFMVISGDWPNATQTSSDIDSVLGTDFLWYAAPGNHEVSDDINNFYWYRDTLVPSLPHVVNYGPAGSINSSYSWTYENAHFVALNGYWNGTTNSGADTAADGDVPPALLTWINNDLTANDQTHEFVFIHEPAYPEVRHTGDALDAHPANRDAFVSALDTQGVETLFVGHDHYYHHDTSAEYPLLGSVQQVGDAHLMSGTQYGGSAIVYVLIDGDDTTYKVYRSTGGAFSLYDQWTVQSEPPTDPPAAPTELDAVAISHAQINLTWTDNANNESAFEIERSTTGSGGPFTLRNTVLANVSNYSDVGLDAEAEYCYRVRATNSVDDSGYSNVDCATTLAEGEPSVEACESFNSGYTTGQVVGTHADWYDGGSGPVVTSANGVAGSVGLAPAANIFTWVAHPFNWNDADFVGVNLSMDYQTDASGHFDDDRVGWMIDDTDTDSSLFFGVQMDPDAGTGYNIEGYWDGTSSTDERRPSLVTLPTLTANAWYNLQTEITKLTATSARIEVTLTALNSDGSLGAAVATGSIADTSALGADAPNLQYFTATSMWPAYKNYTGVQGAVDNPCFEIVSGTQTQYTLTANKVGSGSVTLNPSGGTYASGTDVQLTATADAGWMFSGWSGDLSGSINPDSVTMDSSKTVTATFTEQPGGCLVGEWHFDEASGSTADDSSAYGNDGTVSGATWVSVGVNGALYFDGVDNSVQVPASASLSLSTSRFTFAAWIRADDLSSDWSTIAQRTSADGQWYDWEIYARAADAPDAYRPVLRMDWDGDGAIDDDEQVEGDIVLQPNTWYFVACTYDGSDMKFYIDGTLRGTTHRVDGAIRDGGRDTWIGGNEAWGEYFDGVIDEARIYGCALNQAEIQTLMSPAPLYTLTNNVVGQGSVALDPSGGTYDLGTTVHLTATAASGWVFTGWSGDLSGSTNPTTITMDANKTVTATFQLPQQYTLTDNVVGQGSIALDPSGGTYDLGTTVHLTATAASGWVFAGWSGDLSGSTNPTTITMDAAKTVTATFQIPKYTLTDNVVGQGSIALDPSGGTYDLGTTVHLTATAASGWVFAGWSGDLSGSTNPTTVTMDANKTVTATFQIPQYTLTDNVVGQGSIALDPSGGTYDLGTTVHLTATAASGWVFAGWSGDLSGSTNPTTITMDANKTVTATFQIPQYTLTDNVVGQGSIALDPSGGTYDLGTTVHLTATAASGWVFAGWLGDLSGSTNPTTITMDANKIVTATFQLPQQYTLTDNVLGQGSIALGPSGGTYDVGTTVHLTATAASGWVFAGWSGDLSGSANPTTITMDANKTVTATFQLPQQYTLTDNVVGQGSIALDPSGGTYDLGTTVHLTATAASGWVFGGWSGDLSGSTNPTTVTMDASKTVTATFNLLFRTFLPFVVN